MTVTDTAAWEPRIAAFLCNWCSYAGADLAGVSRFQYPANIRINRVPCSGRIDPAFILRALQLGADGVLVSGCHPGDCHYATGNYYARRRFAVFKKFIDYCGIEPHRVFFTWISASEGQRFADTIKHVTAEVRKLGPATRLVKQFPGNDMALIDDLKREARALFEAKKIDLFIGFKAGTVPHRSQPEFFKDAAALDKLVFDATCANNLAVYVKRFMKRGKRVGIAAVGCVSRSLVELIRQTQVPRDRISIIGIACGGMIDARKANAGASDQSAMAADACKRCRHRTPPLADMILKGMPEIVKPAADPYAAVTAHAARPEKERWEVFKAEMAKCIRCYACRQACPVCFCERCFAERNDPPWVGLTDDPTDTAIFQMTRFLHVSGRCVDCGACERACPAGVDLGLFRLKIEKDIRDMYGHEAGMDPAAPGAMTSYKTDDTEDFMLHI